MKTRKITSQHTYTFSYTGESVTSYISDTPEQFSFGLSFSHKEEGIKWSSHYEGILQLKSKVNPKVWYIFLTQYWDGGEKDIPVERVMMVVDSNANRFGLAIHGQNL